MEFRMGVAQTIQRFDGYFGYDNIRQCLQGKNAPTPDIAGKMWCNDGFSDIKPGCDVLAVLVGIKAVHCAINKQVFQVIGLVFMDKHSVFRVLYHRAGCFEQ